MKSSLFAILLGSAIFATQNASATLLVGFYDFDSNATTESADYALMGFSGTVVKNAEASVTNGGSNDGFYGNTVSPGFVGLNPGTNDGYLRSISGGDPVFRFTNDSAASTSLSSLLFDAASQSGGSAFQVDYRTTASPVTWAGLFNTGSMPVVAGGSGVSADYNDFAASLVGITLSAGEWIEFRFDGTPNGRIDNIALVAIPEPASLLALGCLMGSGAFLRQRRRTLGASVQLA
ncbi:MAG: hypothetical protein RLZZ282_1069 [Verrucomicrobiota bacterium]|jgi:hypothetical protein